MTVKELLDRVSSRELSEWQAYYRVEPFGEERQDLRFALMTANLISPHLAKGHRPKLKDFMLNFEPKKAQTEDSMKMILKGVCSGHRSV